MIHIKNEKGTAFIVSYIVIVVLLILGIVFTARSIVESRIAERQKRAVQAFDIAEAGLERTLYKLKQDFENDTTNPSWADGNIDDLVRASSLTYTTLPYTSTTLGNGSYNVELKNVTDVTGATLDDEIWVKSTGTSGDIRKTVQAYVKIVNLSPWDNVIFAGAGSAGNIINGNVDIRGSVHILATSLGDDDIAIEVVEIGGSGRIGNNYKDMPAELLGRIPLCPTVIFGEETVESLETTLRVRRGLVALSGSATIGDLNVAENAYKETVDGVYNTDGYGGNKGAENVHSDNGTGNSYDLGDSVQFPRLSDLHPDDPEKTFQQYLKANAYVVPATDVAKLTQLVNITPLSNFSYGDIKGSITMDGSGNLAINGIVYIEGNLTMQEGLITYTGAGTILSEGNVLIKSSLLTPAGVRSFPATNVIGIMTPNSITLGDAAQIDIMGAFYAENTIAINKQTNVLGSVVSNYFDMGSQVPNIYQVPELAENLPVGMISESSWWLIKIVAWQKL